MRNLLWLLLLGGLFLTHLSADSVQYQLTSLGGGTYQYQYFLSGNFNPPDPGTYLALDITFDTSYSNLVNTSTLSSNWLSFVLQPVPGNPPGPGDYIAEAKIVNPPLNGTFSVKFAYSPVGGDPAVPGSQAWMEDEFNKSDGSIFQSSAPLPSGLTTPQSIADPAAVPEPSSFALSGMLLAVLIGFAVRAKAHRATATRA